MGDSDVESLKDARAKHDGPEAVEGIRFVVGETETEWLRYEGYLGPKGEEWES